MAFGDFPLSANSPGSHPTGVGGDANTIWHQDNATDRVYELSTTDFSVVRQGDVGDPSIIGVGVGGDANTIWFLDVNLVYELSTTDFSVIRSDTAPGTNPIPRGVGGDASTIWYCESGQDTVHKLSTTDFSSIRSASSPDSWPFGIGGSSTRIWHCDYTENKVYELSTADFSTVLSANSPSSEPVGIGGDDRAIWHSDSNTNKIYGAVDVPAVYPTNPLARASGIKRTFWAGLGGQSVYQVELALGGMSTTYVSPIGSREPTSAVTPTPPPSGLGYQQSDYNSWINFYMTNDIQYILKIFGKVPSYDEWLKWKQTPYFPKYF